MKKTSFSDQHQNINSGIFTSRRDVLKTLTIGGAGMAFSPYSLLAATRVKKERLGIALVGLGYYSTDLLAPALQQTKNCYLAGIVSGTSSKAEVWKKQYGIPEKNVYNYQNFDQIANNPDIDVVYVVLPHQCIKSMLYGLQMPEKHVWCEKPMADYKGQVSWRCPKGQLWSGLRGKQD